MVTHVRQVRLPMVRVEQGIAGMNDAKIIDHRLPARTSEVRADVRVGTAAG